MAWLMDHFFRPVHPASLAVTRILFGFLMLFDIPEERGGAEIDIRWGDPETCHFPLLPASITPRPSYAWICILYAVMWLGALGICLGYKYRTACAAYLLAYWYVLLLDKSFWNNHSYLYGLLGLLLAVSSAGCYWSLDVLLDHERTHRMETVPYWNYFLLKFQVFCMYFLAGLKKLDMEWLDGYSMTNMGKHWVFNFFAYLLTTEQIDYFIVHLTGFLLDLSIGFLLMMTKTRPFALVACAAFHLINSRLFSIGMFPYMCLATMALFCEPDWPLALCKKFSSSQPTSEEPKKKHTKKNRTTIFLLFAYCFTQLFLPWSHFLTKGYNNWTKGLYGYSWDMMVHSWDTTLVVVRIVDNTSGKEVFLDPTAWVLNDRWNKHADMTVQYAQCVRRNLRQKNALSADISVYVDVWCSLNGRFQQRMFHPYYDLLTARWSPFTDIEWLLPLLIEYSDFREQMRAIQEHVYSWSNYSDVLFIADFPGLYLENFISDDLTNISLRVIEGTVVYESEDGVQVTRLHQGESVAIAANVFHVVRTVSETPSCFMYTYVNSTKERRQEASTDRVAQSPFPILEDGQETWESFATMFELIANAVLHLMYDVPMVRRARID